MDLWEKRGQYKVGVYCLPKYLDEEVARLHLEKIAHGCYQAQLGLMDIAYELREGVDSHTVEVWTGYVLDADTALLKWIKSEKSRAKPGE